MTLNVDIQNIDLKLNGSGVFSRGHRSAYMLSVTAALNSIVPHILEHMETPAADIHSDEFGLHVMCKAFGNYNAFVHAGINLRAYSITGVYWMVKAILSQARAIGEHEKSYLGAEIISINRENGPMLGEVIPMLDRFVAALDFMENRQFDRKDNLLAVLAFVCWNLPDPKAAFAALDKLPKIDAGNITQGLPSHGLWRTSASTILEMAVNGVIDVEWAHHVICGVSGGADAYDRFPGSPLQRVEDFFKGEPTYLGRTTSGPEDAEAIGTWKEIDLPLQAAFKLEQVFGVAAMLEYKGLIANVLNRFLFPRGDNKFTEETMELVRQELGYGAVQDEHFLPKFSYIGIPLVHSWYDVHNVARLQAVPYKSMAVRDYIHINLTVRDLICDIVGKLPRV